MKRFIKISLLASIMLTGSCVIQGMESDIDRKERESKKEAEFKTAAAVCQKLHELPLHVGQLILEYAEPMHYNHANTFQLDHGTSSAVISPNGKTITASTRDGMTLLQNPAPNARPITLTRPTRKMVFSHNSRTLACSAYNYDEPIRLWNPETGELIQALAGHTDKVIQLAFSPDDRTLTSVSPTMIKLWNVATGECIQTREFSESNILGLSSDGTMYSDFHKKLNNNGSIYSKTIRLRNCVTGKIIQTLTLYQQLPLSRLEKAWEALHQYIQRITPPLKASFSPDGRIFAATVENGIRLWDVQTGENIRTLTFKDTDEWNDIPLFSFNYDNQTLAATESNTIKVWDITTGDLLQTLTDRCSYHSPTFSRDCASLVLGSWGGTVNLWSGKPNVELRHAFAQGKLGSKLEKFKSGTYLSASEWSRAKQQGATAFGNMVKDVEALKEFAAKTGDGASAQQLAAMHRARKDELEDLRMLEGFLEDDAQLAK